MNRTMLEDLEWNSFQNFDRDDPHWPIVLEMHDWTSHKVATSEWRDPAPQLAEPRPRGAGANRRRPLTPRPRSGRRPAVVVGIIFSDVLGYDVDVLDQMSLEAWMDDHDDAAGNATANTTILYNRVLDTVSPTHRR